MCILLFTKVLNYEVKTIPVNQKFKLQPASNYFLLLALDDVSESGHGLHQAHSSGRKDCFELWIKQSYSCRALEMKNKSIMCSL